MLEGESTPSSIKNKLIQMCFLKSSICPYQHDNTASTRGPPGVANQVNYEGRSSKYKPQKRTITFFFVVQQFKCFFSICFVLAVGHVL